MTTAIGICSAAFSLINANSILSFEQGTNEARLAKQHYERTLRMLLEERMWNFCKRRIMLNRLVDTPLFGYAYAFQLPSDFLKLGRRNPGYYTYEIEGDKLFTDSATMDIQYIYRPDESKFPASFENYLIYSLAKVFGLTLRCDVNLYTIAKQSLEEVRGKAITVDNMNRGPISFPRGSFVLENVRTL